MSDPRTPNGDGQAVGPDGEVSAVLPSTPDPALEHVGESVRPIDMPIVGLTAPIEGDTIEAQDLMQEATLVAEGIDMATKKNATKATKKKASGGRKKAARKAGAKKTGAKKTGAKKTAPRKAAKKTGSKKTGAKKKSASKKYGAAAGRAVKKAVKARKKGTLRSGPAKKKVTSKKQAIAIALNEARKSGAKVPKKRK